MGKLTGLLVRIFLWAVLTAALLAVLAAVRPQLANWEKLYGGTGLVSPPLNETVLLGQPFALEDPNLDRLGLLFATYLKKASGRVELLLLDGPAPPRDDKEIKVRILGRTSIEAGKIKDNSWGKESISPPLVNLGQGREVFLLVRRSGDLAGTPLSIYLDNYLASPFPKAVVLTKSKDGSLRAAEAEGHFSLIMGFISRPNLLTVLLTQSWGLALILTGLLASLGLALFIRPGTGGLFIRPGRIKGGLALILFGLACGVVLGLVAGIFRALAHNYFEYGLYRSAGLLLREETTRWISVLSVLALLSALWIALGGVIGRGLKKSWTGPVQLLGLGGILLLGGWWINSNLLPGLFHPLTAPLNGLYLAFALLTGLIASSSLSGRLFHLGGWAAAVMVVLTLLLGGSLFASSRFSKPQGPNVVLITVDTLRADHLSIHGYFRPTSPNIDRLARESIWFKRALANSSWTAPSFYSMLTSQYPAVLGFEGNAHSRIQDRFLCLAELFQNSNYRTKGIIANTYLKHEVGGLGQGFEEYDESAVHLEPSSPRVTELGLEFIDRHQDRPFFLFLQYQDPHYPWYLQEKYDYYPEYRGRIKSGQGITQLQRWVPTMTGDEVKKIKALYDSNIAFMDEHVGMVLDRLKELGLYEESLIVFTADHGEDFLDKNYFHLWLGHARKLFQEYIHVPLIIKLPGQTEPKVVEEAVELLDLMPTIAAETGLSIPEAYLHDGLPLEVDEQGRVAGKPLISETTSATHQQAAIWKGHKLIHYLRRGVSLLFDLDQDPREERNLADQDPEIKAELEQALAEWNEAVKTSPSKVTGGGARLRQDDVRKLKDLGYM